MIMPSLPIGALTKGVKHAQGKKVVKKESGEEGAKPLIQAPQPEQQTVVPPIQQQTDLSKCDDRQNEQLPQPETPSLSSISHFDILCYAYLKEQLQNTHESIETKYLKNQYPKLVVFVKYMDSLFEKGDQLPKIEVTANVSKIVQGFGQVNVVSSSAFSFVGNPLNRIYEYIFGKPTPTKSQAKLCSVKDLYAFGCFTLVIGYLNLQEYLKE